MKCSNWPDRVVAIAPDNADMLYRLAVCLAHLDRADEAARYVGPL